jgi:hypothetical protein
MSLYGKYVLPALTDFAMPNKAAHAERARWVPKAAGMVLEVGAGSGLNFAHYGARVRTVYALEPSAELRRMAAPRAQRARVPNPVPGGTRRGDSAARWGGGHGGHDLDALHDRGSRARPPRDEARAPERWAAGIRRAWESAGSAGVLWQGRLTPVWRRIAGGCHLNRPIDAMLDAGGFEVPEMECGYASGPRVSGYLYRGVARLGGRWRDVPATRPEEQNG